MSALGRLGNSFFGFKQEQGGVIGAAMQTMGQIADSDASYAAASAQSIQSVYSNGPGIERLWRPVLMWVILFLVVGRWFGWHQLQGLPETEINRIYDFMEMGICGYIPLRSFEKIMSGFQIGNVLKTYVAKKIV